MKDPDSLDMEVERAGPLGDLECSEDHTFDRARGNDQGHPTTG